MYKPIELTKATNAYELLGDVCQRVLDEPKRLNMDTWISQIPSEIYGDTIAREPGPRAPECGTVACIAGWISLLAYTPKYFRSGNFVGGSHEARKLLQCEMSIDDSATEDIQFHYESNSLFYTFPEQDNDVLEPQTIEYAQVVVDKVRAYMTKWEARLKATPVTVR